MNENEKEETPILEIDTQYIQIPECCREGWPSCPHVLKKVKPEKRNIGV